MNRAQLQDGIQYFKALRPRRLWNATRITASYLVSKWTKKRYHWGDPIALSIEPTTSCNLRCPECPSGLRAFSRPIGMLDVELNKNIIDELKATLTYITYYFQGEPFLNPAFTQMVKYASDRNIYTATSTNAHYLTDKVCKQVVDSGLSRMIISIDGVNQESYSKYRIGGSLDKVIEGTKRMVHWKKQMKSKTPFIVWQFIVFNHNEREIEEVKELAKEVGVDHLGIKTAQLYNFEDKADILPTNEKYSRYTKGQEGVKIKNRLFNHCWRMWHSCVVTWDGRIAPCCFDKDASHQLGQIEKEGFRKIWKGKSYQSFRKLVLKSRSNIDICQNCSEGTKIWA